MPSWTHIKDEILSQIDLESEYRSLGATPSSNPDPNGWISCHAIGRDDRNPSAAFNIGDSVERGRYIDFADTGISIGFFDAAARFGKFPTWIDAVKHYAVQCGVKLPKGKRQKQLTDKFFWQPWNDVLGQLWCDKKPGCTLDGLKACHARLARWPVPAKDYLVIALPVFGVHLHNYDPTGYIAFAVNGKPLCLHHKGREAAKSRKQTTTAKTITPSEDQAIRLWAGPVQLIKSSDIIWKVEGATDLIALMSVIPDDLHGKHIALTNANGTNEVPKLEQIESLKGKTVYVIHDADKPGQGFENLATPTGAARWCHYLAKAASVVKNVSLPYPVAEKHGKDLRDWITEGHTYQDLLALAEQADPYTGPSHEENGDNWIQDLHGGNGEFMQMVGIEVLGERRTGECVIYSRNNRKIIEAHVNGRTSIEALTQWFGESVAAHVSSNENEDTPNTWSLQDARCAITLAAGKKRLNDGSIKGVGCWPVKGKAGRVDGVLLVGAGEAAIWDRAQLTKIEAAQYKDLILDISTSEPWYDFEQLTEFLGKAANPDWAYSAIEEAEALFSRWRWVDLISPRMLTGLIMATWVQTVHSFRPHVSITGATNTGKSMLMQGITQIFGALAFGSAGTTAAGMRQVIREQALAVLCDEFESSPARAQILEMIRLASRGSRLVMGSAGQRPVFYTLQHILWVAAIETGLIDAPDANRFISLELVPAAEGEHGKLTLPPNEDLNLLGQKLLACALRSVFDAREHFRQLREIQIPGIDNRVTEAISVPAAMIASTYQGGSSDAKAELLNLIEVAASAGADQGSDEQDLAQAIMQHVLVNGREKVSVASLVRNYDYSGSDREQLHNIGIGVGTHDGARFLRLDHKNLAAKIFRQSKWAGKRIDTILLRLPSAERKLVRLGGLVVRGLNIPFESIECLELESDNPE